MVEESILITQAQSGTAGAFDDLVRPYLQRAYRTACLITQQKESASDALQEALLRAYRSLGNLRQGSPFYPWFARILVNEALKQANRQKLTSFLPLPEQVTTTTPEGVVLSQEEREQIWLAVQGLGVDHRLVIVLRYYTEMSEAEMAAVLNVSPGTVKSRLSRARQALERKLQASYVRTSPHVLQVRGGMEHD